MNPNRMGLEEQTEAHALLAKAIVLLRGMPGRPVAGSGHYRGLPEVHALPRNPQVGLSLAAGAR